MTKGRNWLIALSVFASASFVATAWAGSLPDTNLVDLVRESQSIVVGQVSGITDGIDERGLPYTEITMDISETIQGHIDGTYVFRQFGLTEPRMSADGTKKMMPAPQVFPKFHAGEQVVLFLNRPASVTGLQTTIGLAGGKFTIGATRAENGLGNIGVFRNVSVENGLTTDNDLRMLETEAGAVNSDTFLSFLRRAVDDRWVARGLMWRTDEGRPGPGGKPVKKTQPGPGRTDRLPTGSSTSTTLDLDVK